MDIPEEESTEEEGRINSIMKTRCQICDANSFLL